MSGQGRSQIDKKKLDLDGNPEHPTILPIAPSIMSELLWKFRAMVALVQENSLI